MGLDAFLAAFAGRSMFIAWKPVPRVNGGTDKVPTDPRTGQPSDAQNPAGWMLPHIAQATGLPLGVVISEGCGLACIDLDHALQADGSWSPLALDVCARFPGAAIEISYSGTGLHIFFACQPIPAHRTKRDGLALEVYTRGRFIALTGAQMTGDVRTDHTGALLQLIADYLPAPLASAMDEWTSEPQAGWRPATDEQIIARLRNRQSARSAFGGGATFAQLFDADLDALQRAHPSSNANGYDASSADQALANHLAYGAGYNCEHTLALMWQSALARDKWQREDYLRRTILRAVAGKVLPASHVATSANDLAAPPAGDPYAALTDRTDKGNANLLIALAGGDLRHVPEIGRWMRWDGKRWQNDDYRVVIHGCAMEVAKHYYAKSAKLRALATGESEVKADEAAKWAVKCRSRASIENMIALASTDAGVPLPLAQLDQDRYLFGVENGVIDLRTGELRELEAREDYITRRSPVRYNPEALAPRWEALIHQATGAPIEDEVEAFTARPNLARYMHKALGYALTGLVREQKFFFAIGAGSNGKGLIFDTVKAILGPYAVVLPSEILMATRNSADPERPTSVAATLAGARFVVASESKEGQKLDLAAIKMHTGDTEMTARRMRQDSVTFKITHKIWLLTNVRPAIDHPDAAVKGRLHLVPFDRRWNRPGEFERDPTLPDGDKNVMQQLEAEREGILAWLVRGARLYLAEGLTPPSEVVDTTKEYVMDQDALGRWLETMERCHAREGTPLAALFVRFSLWCQAEGCALEPANSNNMGRALRSRGVKFYINNAGSHAGIRPRAEKR